VSDPVAIALVGGAFTLAGAIVANLFGIWKQTIETRKNTVATMAATVASTAAVVATTATHQDLRDASERLEQVYSMLATDPAQAALKSEVALLRAKLAVAISGAESEPETP
jgi:hypothetical protein